MTTSPAVRPTQLHTPSHPLDVFFAPKSVAIFGATDTPGSVGRALMSNLVRNPFGGILFPINPRRSCAHGVEAYPNLAALPEPAELAIVATPAVAVPDILSECRASGVRAAIVLSAGFGDSGPAGAELERQIRESLRGGAMRVLGVNSFGVACPRIRLNATFAPAMVQPGKVGFLSQSGALLTALLSHGHAAPIGCSVFVSVGSLINIGWSEWLDYLAQDPQTEYLGVYLEHLDNAHSFFAAVRRVVPSKPVILLKGGGRTNERMGDEVFDQECRSSGVLQVYRLADFFRMAAHLPSRPVPNGRRLAILTNTRGPAILAADALRESGGALAVPASETVMELREILATRWNQQNPIDLGDDCDADQFARAAYVAARDPNTDALLVLLAPGATIDPVRAAQGIAEVARTSAKPVLACWLWGAASSESLAVLREASVSTFHSPEAAVRNFGYLWRYPEIRRPLTTCDAALSEAAEAVATARPADVLVEARRSARIALPETKVRELFSLYELPMCQKCETCGETEVVQAAAAVGYPVLIELSARPGVAECVQEVCRLKADDPAQVRRAVNVLGFVARMHFGAVGPTRVTVQSLASPSAVEVIVRITTHPQYGPMIRLEEKGRPGELSQPAVVALVPLTSRTVREIIQQCPSLCTLPTQGGGRSGLDALEEFLIRLSRMVDEQRWIKEVTVAPLRVEAHQVMAGDVHVLLQDGTGIAECC